MKKTETRFLSLIIFKINSEGTKDLNLRLESMKLLEIRETLQDINTGNGFKIKPQSTGNNSRHRQARLCFLLHSKENKSKEPACGMGENICKVHPTRD